MREREARGNSAKKRATKPADKRVERAGVTFATVRRIALALPGVEEGLSYGTPGFRVRGKFLARMWEDGQVLVVKCGDTERDLRMQADPETFFITEHYRGYPTVLVRLSRVTPAELREVLQEAWRRQAPKRLVQQHDE
jgi:hypothetical protein